MPMATGSISFLDFCDQMLLDHGPFLFLIFFWNSLCFIDLREPLDIVLFCFFQTHVQWKLDPDWCHWTPEKSKVCSYKMPAGDRE